MIWDSGWLIVLLLISAVCGGAIGLQREAAQKPAGFRTHLLVALGCCAFAEIGRLTGDTRIAANILTGIGFIGAGAIFRAGLTAHGLTTAASVWGAAAVGVAVAQDTPQSLVIAISVTILTVIVLTLSDSAVDRFFASKTLVNVTYEEQCEQAVDAILSDNSSRYSTTGDFKITNLPDGRFTEATFRVQLKPGKELVSFIEQLSGTTGVRSVVANAPISST